MTLVDEGSEYNRIVMRIPSLLSEHFYGLGEQFTDFDLKGHKYTIWTREQGETLAILFKIMQLKIVHLFLQALGEISRIH